MADLGEAGRRPAEIEVLDSAEPAPRRWGRGEEPDDASHPEPAVELQVPAREAKPTFEAFVAVSSAPLLRTALLLTGERTAAEDLLQEVLERMVPRWRWIRDPLAYARTSLARRAASRWRSRRRAPAEVPLGETGSDQIPDDVPDPAAAVAQRSMLLGALAQLPPRQRAVVVLRYFNDLSEQEIAAALRCAPGTVKSQTSKAMRRLRQILAEEQPGGGNAAGGDLAPASGVATAGASAAGSAGGEPAVPAQAARSLLPGRGRDALAEGSTPC